MLHNKKKSLSRKKNRYRKKFKELKMDGIWITMQISKMNRYCFLKNNITSSLESERELLSKNKKNKILMKKIKLLCKKQKWNLMLKKLLIMLK